MKKKTLFWAVIMPTFIVIGLTTFLIRYQNNTKTKIGEVVDEYNSIKVFQNGNIQNTSGRNTTFIVIGLTTFLIRYQNNTKTKIGEVVDEYNSIKVFQNGNIQNTSGRNTVKGYNLGLKYQCVEFVKRYYYYHYNHKMPNSYGHAKSFFHKGLKDGKLNKDRGLIQFSNGSKEKPKTGDLIIFDGHIFNKFGHVAIVSKVTSSSVEIIQQNTFSSRKKLKLHKTKKGKWTIKDKLALGWLRMK